jgi:hypothetical protein
VARNLEVNANLSSAEKESLITIFSGQIWSNLFEQLVEKLLVHAALILVVRFSMSLGYFTQQVQISVFSKFLYHSFTQSLRFTLLLRSMLTKLPNMPFSCNHPCVHLSCLHPKRQLVVH